MPCLAKNCCTSCGVCTGALSWCRIQLPSRHFSGRFRRTDSHRNSLLIVCPSGAYSWCTIPSESENTSNMTFVFLHTWQGARCEAETWDPSTVTIAVLSPGCTRRPRTRHLSHCSQETACHHMNAQTNHRRLSDVANVGHLLANAAQTSRTHASCADHRVKLHRMSPRRSHSHPLSPVLSVSCYCERLF